MPKRILALWLVAVAAASPCAYACEPDLPGGRRVESAPVVLAYRTVPESIAVGRHFSVELVVCPRTAGASVELAKVDAIMPVHRHGMNYRPSLRALGGNRFRADGLMFHMPGHWEMLFEVRTPGGTEQLRHRIDLH